MLLKSAQFQFCSYNYVMYQFAGNQELIVCTTYVSSSNGFYLTVKTFEIVKAQVLLSDHEVPPEYHFKCKFNEIFIDCELLATQGPYMTFSQKLKNKCNNQSQACLNSDPHILTICHLLREICYPHVTQVILCVA